MKVTPIEPDIDLTAQPGYVRSPGLHMSDIYGAYYEEADKKRYGKGRFSKDEGDAYMSAGLAFERVLEAGFRGGLAERPGEFRSSNGIIYSPDLLISNGVPLRLGEIKATWKSSKDTPTKKGEQFGPKFDKYMSQLKLYAHDLETPYARLYTFFVNGDYKRRVPQFKAWDLEFTAQELHEEWQTMMGFAKQRKML